MVLEETADEEPVAAARTAAEIRSVGQQQGSVVVPVGSVEQHGKHLPVATDTLLADAIARFGARRVSAELPVLLTPPIWSGVSSHHMDFGGTISLGVETMIAVLSDVAESVLDNGFDAVVFLNGHGGNKSVVGTAVSKIGAAFPDAQILGVTYFDLAAPFIDDIRDSDSGGMAHGGEFETSLLLHLRPDLVRMQRAEATSLEEPYDRSTSDMFETGPLAVYRSFLEYSESGAVGDPSLASAEKGENLYERLGREIETLLVAVHEHNR